MILMGLTCLSYGAKTKIFDEPEIQLLPCAINVRVFTILGWS